MFLLAQRTQLFLKRLPVQNIRKNKLSSPVDSLTKMDLQSNKNLAKKINLVQQLVVTSFIRIFVEGDQCNFRQPKSEENNKNNDILVQSRDRGDNQFWKSRRKYVNWSPTCYPTTPADDFVCRRHPLMFLWRRLHWSSWFITILANIKVASAFSVSFKKLFFTKASHLPGS